MIASSIIGGTQRLVGVENVGVNVCQAIVQQAAESDGLSVLDFRLMSIDKLKISGSRC